MKTVVSFLFTVLLFISCKKQEIASPLIVGDYESVDLVGINCLVEGNLGSPQILDLDLNDDGIKDVKIYSDLSPVFSGELTSTLYLESLHVGCRFRATEEMDSMYSCVGYQSTTNPGNGNLMYIESFSYSCYKPASYWTLDSTYVRRRLTALNNGDILSVNDTFYSGRIYIAEPSTSEINLIDTNGNVSYYQQIKVDKDCPEFPVGTSQYVGIQLITKDGPKLCWIRVQYFGNNRLKIFDCSIQK